MSTDRCAYPRCRNTDIAVIYYEKPVCWRCWLRIDTMPVAEYKAKLKVPQKPGG